MRARNRFGRWRKRGQTARSVRRGPRSDPDAAPGVAEFRKGLWILSYLMRAAARAFASSVTKP